MLLLLLLPLAWGTTRPPAQNTRSPHGSLNLPCQNCHTVYGWKPIRAIPEFDHSQTRYPLRGMHEGVSCTACHTKMVFSNVGNKCADCHADIHKGQMGAACESCHTVRGWNVSLQQIKEHMNRFPLTGAHAALGCEDCHKSGAVGQFKGLSTACYSCHQKDYAAAANPNHAAGRFATTCEGCHTVDTWLNAKFDHSLTGFPLTGGHAVPPRQCEDCHVNNNYSLQQTACVGCHLKDFQNTTNPNHAQQGFSQSCEACHTTVAWSPANFDHSKSGFPLTGAHMVPPRQCSDCHVGNNYTLTQTACVSCHLNDYQSTNNPNHTQQGIPQTCDVCHSTTAWQPANYDHSKTGFPLTGAHTVPPRQCTDCHVGNNYTITQTACVSCHLNDFQGAKNPDHVGAGFPQTCETCHTTTAWQPASFDHSKSGFPLTGSHTVPPRQCADCHINNNYTITQTACVSCHQQDYNNAKSPVDHIAAKFATTCETCHDTVSWNNGKFDHSTTGWALTGSHTVPPRACTDCHVGSNYSITQTTCVSCHQQDYNNAKSPVDHITANFPTTCETCHDTVNWNNGKFDHSTTGWALTGSHTVPPRACTDCHVGNNYKLTQTACVTCHLNDFNNTTSPNHVSAGFPQTCEVCHDTVKWTDATFDHSKTGFPLTGSHTVPPRVCADCHVNNNYTTLPTACYGCHKTDYQNATNPNHIAAGFPTTCETCHDTIKWADGKFNHTWFPMNHGGANGVCTTCHTNPNDFTVFTCTNCHTKSQTDPKHNGVRGYVYNSVNCYQCHKNGGGG
ncbi:MAG TPA: cytochrome c3 family protein [Terriglobales bacterium]|nr:cytochrome c3 family protein [Terriglobales bacterium]